MPDDIWVHVSIARKNESYTNPPLGSLPHYTHDVRAYLQL